MIYTGLRRLIGSPSDFTKNQQENNFPDFDISIPLNETNEKGGQEDIQQIFDNSNLRGSFEYNQQPSHIGKRRVEAPSSGLANKK